MLKSRAQHALCAIGVALLSTVGCVERPTDRLAAVERLIGEARAGNAAIYVPEDVRQLERSLTSLAAEVIEEDARPAFMRDYAHAQAVAATLLRDAHSILERASRKHSELKSAARAALEEAEVFMAESRRLIASMKAHRGLGSVARQKGDSEVLTRSLISVRQAIDAEDYLAAEARARAIVAQAGVLSGQIQTMAIRLGDSGGTRIARN